MSKRAGLRLEALDVPPETASEPVVAPTPIRAKVPTPPPETPERITTIYARVPWSLGERLRDLARDHSRASGRRVTVNDLVAEAIGELLNKQGR